MSDEKRVATAEILNTSVHVPVKLNDRYQGPPGPPGKDGNVRFEDLTEAQIEQLRGPQGLTGKTPQITVQVETGEPGTEASVMQSGTAEAPVIALTIPRGDPGATPQITVQVKTGEPGTAASVKQTGTAEAPVIELTIPRGDTGSLGSLTINGKAPDAAGKVTLTAADVGAASAAELNQLKTEIEKKYSTELLWENASPDSSFDEQTITFDWKDYNYCMIYFLAYIGSSLRMFSSVSKKGDRLRFYFLTDTDSGASGQFRDFYSGESRFGKAVRLKDSSNLDQKACVPLGIYGVKGV